MQKEIVVHNWDELQKAVFDDVWDPKISRYRDNRIYRGTADMNWDLIPLLNLMYLEALKNTDMLSWLGILAFGNYFQ